MAKKERKLTPAEMKRKEKFDIKVEQLQQQGYIKKDLTIGIVQANVMAIVIMMPVILLTCWLYMMVNGEYNSITIQFRELLVFIVGIFALTTVHEGIHGATWTLFSKKKFKDIEFGVIWSMLTPYCTCESALTKKQYIIGAMMPTLIVGIIPAAIAIIMQNKILFLLGIFMILGGGGDALIALKLLAQKQKSKEDIYMDHPYECGIVVFERN